MQYILIQLFDSQKTTAFSSFPCFQANSLRPRNSDMFHKMMSPCLSSPVPPHPDNTHARPTFVPLVWFCICRFSDEHSKMASSFHCRMLFFNMKDFNRHVIDINSPCGYWWHTINTIRWFCVIISYAGAGSGSSLCLRLRVVIRPRGCLPMQASPAGQLQAL